MASLQSLAKDTALYGMSSIIGRFLNYLLVPLYTAKISAASGGYGTITEVYAYVALLYVLLTFGMETTLFRFLNRNDQDPERVYTTTLTVVGGVGLLFFASVVVALPWLSQAMGYPEHPEYIWMMAATVALDAFQAIPFCYLRYQKRPLKFVSLKLGFIVLNILLNMVVFLVLPAVVEDFNIQVGYVFAINLLCTSLITIGFWRELLVRWQVDFALLRRMLSYAWPILVLGIAGILNQTADKMIFPRLVPSEMGKVQLGIYGAVGKIAMIMALITQAFRYAYEPFVFASAKEGNDSDNRRTYALTMKYFIIFTLFAFLAVMAYLDILRHLIGRDYWSGLRVIPIVMLAEIFMGIYFNLSFWYKLTDRTIWGAWFSGAGCIVLIAANIIFIPQYGYMASAWAGVAGYGTAMLLSYFVGQRYYPIAYPLRSIGGYALLTAVLFGAIMTVQAFVPSLALRLVCNTFCLALFLAVVVRFDLPLSSLPVVGKYFRK